jgi:phage terminase large subunit
MGVPFESRMYFTCNPGGVGHAWVKRLFIDKQYKKTERADDYTFIKSVVYENEHLMKNDPSYIRNLENLPDDRRRAMLDGDWDVYEGQYFNEFNRKIHVIEPFVIPHHWNRYVSIDYGLDMFAALWFAVDEAGRAYVYKEIHESNLIISDAARRLKEVNNCDNILMSFAPPDLFNRRQDTGKSAVDIFMENGWYFYKSNNNRVQGWYDLKEWLKPYDKEDGSKEAKLVIFSNCVNLIRCLPQLQHDAKKPEDVANEPHEFTHAPDALRGFVCGRPTASEPTPDIPDVAEYEEDVENIDTFINFGV